MRGLDSLAKHAFVADEARGLAQAAIAAINDESPRASSAKALRAIVETDYARKDILDRLAAIIHRAEAAA